MNDRMRNDFLYLALAIAFFFVVGSLWAGPRPYDDEKDYSKEPPPVEKSWCETPSLWEVRIGAPGWLAGLSGESGVKGVVDSVDVSFNQLVRHLTHFPIALSINARYQRWEFWVDGQYIALGTSATLPGLLFTDAVIFNRPLKDSLLLL